MSATDGGIGSVATSAVPSFANTRSTSGNGREPRVELQLHADRLLDAGAGNPQRVQRDVAFVEARNELAAHARREHGAERHDEHARRPRPRTRNRSAARSSGSYSRRAPRMTAFSCSATLPRTSTATAAGTNVMRQQRARPSARATTVSAIGWNIFPSTPDSAKIGR